MYGKTYSINLHTDYGTIQEETDFQFPVVVGRVLSCPKAYCDNLCFIGYTYEGYKGGYITSDTIVPEEGN